MAICLHKHHTLQDLHFDYQQQSWIIWHQDYCVGQAAFYNRAMKFFQFRPNKPPHNSSLLKQEKFSLKFKLHGLFKLIK